MNDIKFPETRDLAGRIVQSIQYHDGIVPESVITFEDGSRLRFDYDARREEIFTTLENLPSDNQEKV